MIDVPLIELPEVTGELSTAELSPCGTYRYRLDRVWNADLPIALWVMLNPSTANAYEDDRTIGRCRSFSKREGCGGMGVVNINALRATKPFPALLEHPDPVGPENLAHIRRALDERPALVIAAWGVNADQDHARDVAQMISAHLARFGKQLMCLGVTKDGHPQHPLYVKGDAPLIPLRKAA